jgi:GT2 family glycosyltransferase
VDNRANLDASDLPDGVLLVPCPANPGYGGGCNRGVLHLEREGRELGWVCLNHDLEIEHGFLDAAARALADGAGAAGGPIRSGRDPSHLWYAGGTVNWILGIVHQSQSLADASRRHRVGFIPGTAIAIAAEAWDAVGGFDERFFLYNEDLDLCLRLRRAGWELAFEPGMACSHFLGAATGSSVESALYLEQLSRTRLRPFQPLTYRLYLATIHTAWVVLRSTVIAVTGPDRRTRVAALLRGHLAALSAIARPPRAVVARHVP